jgi:hypothetical protein
MSLDYPCVRVRLSGLSEKSPVSQTTSPLFAGAYVAGSLPACGRHHRSFHSATQMLPVFSLILNTILSLPTASPVFDSKTRALWK